MGRKEVERWDPPNAVTPKLPFPMWGATSKYVKHNDLAGPVFPVERKNDAATMTPKAEVPEAQKSVSYPVFAIEKSSHEYKCDEIADIKLPKLFVGPVLVDEGKSGYVPPKPLVTDQPQINAPVFKGVSSECTFTPMLPPKVEPEVLMSVPAFPVDHGSKYTTQEFGCSGAGLKVEKEKQLMGPGNRAPGDRHAAIIDGKNKYEPEVSHKEAPKPMHGPKLPGIENSHSFGPVPARIAPAEARMEMPGPVYPGVEGKNEYCKIDERVHGELLFAGPKFPGVEDKNCYQEYPEKVHNQPLLIGPCYPTVDHECKFIPEVKERAEGQLAMAGPKFRGVADTSLYNETPARAPIEGDRLMTAPIFPGIEANNKYGPTEPPLAPTEKMPKIVPMSTPKYPGIESKNKYNLDALENGFPDSVKTTAPPMTAPKYPGVEESHKYGPITERKEAPKETNAPVYIEDGANKYSHIPEKHTGELIQQAPVYRGVESKNTYAPSEEKVVNQPLLIGPCYPNVEHDCKFIPETTRVEGQLTMAGPKFRGVDDSSKYNETPMKAPIEGQRLMTAPIFPGIEASNSYGTALYA